MNRSRQVEIALAAIHRLENKAHTAAVQLATEMDRHKEETLKREVNPNAPL